MADPTNAVSLKPRSGVWRGMSRQVNFNRGDRRFRAIVNGFVSPDGTEIRAMPGFKCVVNVNPITEFNDSHRDSAARPDADVFSIVRMTSMHGFKVVRGRIIVVGESNFRKTGFDGTGTVATIDDISDDGTNITLTYSGVDVTVEPGVLIENETIYIQGVTGIFASILNDLYHRVTTTPPTSTTVILDTTLGGSGGLDTTDDNGEFSKVRPENQDLTSLTTWSLEGPAGVTAPLNDTNVAMVANRQRDWGKLSFGSGVFDDYKEGHRAGATDATDYLSRRRQRVLPYRTNLEALGDRVLIAAPGYGCVFQAPVKVPVKTGATHGGGAGVPIRYNDIYDMPRSLGVPKGVGAEATALSLGAADPRMEPGTYIVRIAFKDQGTGEEGLPSEEFEVTIPAGSVSHAILIQFLHPGYWFSETLAHTVRVYVSGRDVQGVNFQGVYTFSTDLETKFGLPPSIQPSLLVRTTVELDVFDSDPGDIVVADPDVQVDANQGPDLLAQMPMGCKVMATVRGVTFFGGNVGDTGINLELQHGTLSANFEASSVGSLVADPNWDVNNTIAHAFIDADDASVGTQWNVAHHIIPPAYAGQMVFSLGEDNSDTAGLFPVPVEFMRLDKYDNHRQDTVAGTTDPEQFYIRWLMEETVHKAQFLLENRTGVDNIDSYLLLPTGQVWWSEAGVPGTVPAVNRLFLDAKDDEDVEAIGRLGNSVVFCTRTQTSLMSWSNNPLGADPSLLSSEFGAIAPDMVEFDGGIAWISDRGPVAIIGGALEWIGREVEALFSGVNARYLRDGRGLMPHSWGAHDPERGLIYFGMRADRLTFSVNGNTYPNATDEERSRFPCDEVLVWSYRNNAWSIWQPPSNLQIFDMERILCDDGVYRMAFLTGERSSSGEGNDFFNEPRIFALDDAWADTNTQPITAIASTGKTSSNIFDVSASTFNTAGTATPAQIQTNLGNDSFTRVGMQAILVSLANDTFTLLGETSITAVGSDTQVTLADSFTWNAGDILYVGTQTMRLETFEESWGQSKRPTKINSSAHRFSQNSTFVTNDVDSPTVTEVNFDNFVAQGRPSPSFVQARAITEHATVNLGGDEIFRTMGFAIGLGRQARTERGTNRGQDTRLEFTYYGGQQIRINDIEIELGIAGS